jgi:hypothetical protein
MDVYCPADGKIMCRVPEGAHRGLRSMQDGLIPLRSHTGADQRGCGCSKSGLRVVGHEQRQRKGQVRVNVSAVPSNNRVSRYLRAIATKVRENKDALGRVEALDCGKRMARLTKLHETLYLLFNAKENLCLRRNGTWTTLRLLLTTLLLSPSA